MMPEILRDPVWQFVGATLTLVTIALSILLFFRQRTRKSLAYYVLANTPVLTVGEEIRGLLTVSYQNTPVRNVQLLLLKIQNSGNIPIVSADFEHPLSIRFGSAARILSHEVVHSTPSDLSPTISLHHDELTFLPLLLNPNDQVTIKCLVSEHGGEVIVTGRIVGVSKIIQAKEPFMKRAEPLFGGVIGLISAMIGSLVALGFRDSRFGFYIVAIAGGLLLILCIAINFKKQLPPN